MSNAQNISNSGLDEIKVAVYDKSCDICVQTRDSVKAVYNNITSGDHDDASAAEVNQIYQRVVSEHDSLSKLVNIINTAKEYYAEAESQLASKMKLDNLTIDKCATIGSLVAATSLTAWQIFSLAGDADSCIWPENTLKRNLIYPILGSRVVQGFPKYTNGLPHNGIDIVFDNKMQSREIRAAADGTAYFSVMMGQKDGKYFMYGLGNNVTLSCDNGLTIEYAHLNDFPPDISEQVQEKLNQMGITKLEENSTYWKQSEFGNRRIMLDVGPIAIKAGQNIGTVGSTGVYLGNSPSEHLHLGVKQDGVYVDPRDYFGI